MFLDVSSWSSYGVGYRFYVAVACRVTVTVAGRVAVAGWVAIAVASRIVVREWIAITAVVAICCSSEGHKTKEKGCCL